MQVMNAFFFQKFYCERRAESHWNPIEMVSNSGCLFSLKYWKVIYNLLVLGLGKVQISPGSEKNFGQCKKGRLGSTRLLSHRSDSKVYKLGLAFYECGLYWVDWESGSLGS